MANQMRFATDLSKGILGAPDSEEMWTEILSHIPDEVLLRPGVRILNVACGHGTPAIVLAKRMISLGVAKSDVQDSIWLLDKYYVFTNPAKKVLGFKHVVTADFLQWETDMKFDAVIGNPPYQSEKGTGTQPLWPLFVKKGYEHLNEAGYLAMITPNKWCGHTANVIQGNIRLFKDLFKGKLVHANIQECSKYFPGVGGYANSFSYFVISNSGYKFPTIVTLTEKTTIDVSAFEYLPLRNITSVTLSILDKVKIATSYKFKQVSTGFQNQNAGSIVISMAQRLHYEKLNVYYDKESTFKATSKSTISTVKFSDSSQEKVEMVFRSKLYKFLHYIFWNGDNFGTTFYNSLPYVDLTRTWTDAELYAHFNLTQEEIDYIESVVK